MRRDPIGERIQRPAPRALPAMTTVTLPVGEVRPVIRIAHRGEGALDIAERIILDHELVLIVRGRCRFRTRDREFALAAHHLLLIPPFLPHAFAPMGPCTHLAVHFDLSPEVPRQARDLERRRPYQVRFAEGLAIAPHRVLAPADGVEPALHRLVDAWRRGPVGRLESHAELTSIVARLLAAGRAVAGDPADAGLERARAAAAERFLETLTVADLARIAGLSPSRFAHRFRAWSGYAPMEWLRRLRVEHARELLADPELSIKAVAGRCGFDDQYHFSRVFRRIDGLSPSHYRAARLAGKRGASRE